MNGHKAPGWVKILGSGLVVAAIWILSTVWSAAHSAGALQEEVAHLKSDLYIVSQNEMGTNHSLDSLSRQVYLLSSQIPELSSNTKALTEEVTKLRIEMAKRGTK